MDKLYIDTKDGRIYLDYEQERSLRMQISKMNALNLLDSIGCLNPEVLSDDDLVELADRLDNMYFDNVGENEVEVVDIFNDDYDNILKFEGDEEEADEEGYEIALAQLGELALDDTAYEYYRNCLADIFYNDKISAKNGEVGYSSFADVLADARRTANK